LQQGQQLIDGLAVIGLIQQTIQLRADVPSRGTISRFQSGAPLKVTAQRKSGADGLENLVGRVARSVGGPAGFGCYLVEGTRAFSSSNQFSTT
jgi:hypothetical protein